MEGNLWLVKSNDLIWQSMASTNHKFPTTVLHVSPKQLKSAVQLISAVFKKFCVACMENLCFGKCGVF